MFDQGTEPGDENFVFIDSGSQANDRNIHRAIDCSLDNPYHALMGDTGFDAGTIESGDRRRDRAYLALFLLALAAAIAVIAVHLRAYPLPLGFLALGFLTRRVIPRHAFVLFAFLLPLINSLPSLIDKTTPFNYIAPLLFYLAGLTLGGLRRRSVPAFPFPWSSSYLFYLTMLLLAVLATLVRWSNVSIPGRAFFRDTPVTTAGDRLSFAILFPVLTLFLAAAAPYAASLAREAARSSRAIWDAINRGFLFSLAIAILQRTAFPGLLSQRWWVVDFGHANGGFSDFNGFGLCAGLLFLRNVLFLLYPDPAAADNGRKDRRARYFFMLTSLGGVFLSGSRTALFFVLVAVVCLLSSPLFTKKKKALFIALIAVLFVVAGGKLRDRVLGSRSVVEKLWTTHEAPLAVLDKLSDSRLTMIAHSARMISRYPIAGVGGGNFFFQLKQDSIGRKTILELPLNQYLLPAAEMGLLGLLAFILFLRSAWRRQGRKDQKILLGTLMTVFIFGTPLWLPEGSVLFWLVLAECRERLARPRTKKKAWLGAAVLLVFVLASLLSATSLHPLTWSRAAGAEYDYGFWYKETDDAGGTFRWTRSAAGLVVRLDGEGRVPGLRIAAAAPFTRLPDAKQRVAVYWKGRRRQSLEFTAPGAMTLDRLGGPGAVGFLEFRIEPAFNLKKMGLGPETRDLGIRIYLK